MKILFETLAFLFLVGEGVTIYTLMACVSYGVPFPAWFHTAWYILSAVTLMAICGVVALLVRSAKRHRFYKRMGMIRYDRDTGRYYYER
jgi:hypothetical protein